VTLRFIVKVKVMVVNEVPRKKQRHLGRTNVAYILDIKTESQVWSVTHAITATTTTEILMYFNKNLYASHLTVQVGSSSETTLKPV